MGPKCNQKCHCKREAEGDLIEAGKKKNKKTMCGWKQGKSSDYNRREEGHVLEEEGSRIRERRCYTAGSEYGERSHEPRNTRNAAVDAGKGKKMDSLLQPPEGV